MHRTIAKMLRERVLDTLCGHVAEACQEALLLQFEEMDQKAILEALEPPPSLPGEHIVSHHRFLIPAGHI